MRKALGSNPSVSMIKLQSKHCRIRIRLSVCVHCDWLARIAKGECHRGFVCDGVIFADGHAMSNAPDLFRPRKLTGTWPRRNDGERMQAGQRGRGPAPCRHRASMGRHRAGRSGTLPAWAGTVPAWAGTVTIVLAPCRHGPALCRHGPVPCRPCRSHDVEKQLAFSPTPGPHRSASPRRLHAAATTIAIGGQCNDHACKWLPLVSQKVCVTATALMFTLSQNGYGAIIVIRTLGPHFATDLTTPQPEKQTIVGCLTQAGPPLSEGARKWRGPSERRIEAQARYRLKRCQSTNCLSRV